ncbi:calcium-binding protein [Paraliomyxa miuraensis]|uniref:calcium-binding protein n=1 Tax=Paraliomyxa miuraensis TaxID=376150 RepID=UPI00225781C3|nr:hypothetical protein [Paraliomyxa miuraensis]MCX4241803.1 hypothetical protein [Paraliomyxa miuraensis]
MDNIYHQGSGGVDGVAEAGDHFGGAVAAGNFNGDSDSGNDCDDLAIASPDEDVGSIADAGYVYTILGGTSGLSTTGDLAWHQDSTGVEDAAEEDDRFGLRLYTGDEDGDGYDELAVVTPGDSCIEGHGEAVHLFYGSSSGITLSGDVIQCHDYACTIDAANDTYACHTYSPVVHASGSADTIAMFFGNDIVHGGDGNDTIAGGHGNDVVFGGSGNDTLFGGPGLDMLIGGAGDDVFVVDLGCQVMPGEVIDGGPGSDTVKSHLTGSQLTLLGVTLVSIETYTTISEGSGDCEPFPFEEGPWLKPRVELSWDDLPNSDSVYTSTTSGVLDLTIANQSADALTVDLSFQLTVRGFTVEHTDSVSLSASGSTVYGLDLEDFIPLGVDPEEVPVGWFELPTSAHLLAQAELSISSVPQGSASAPLLFGHLEDAGAELVVYRQGALESTYYGGDLHAWRLGGNPPSVGFGQVYEARLEAAE